MVCRIKEIQSVSRVGLAFIAECEGMILHAYRDSVGIATIGIGSTYYENGLRVKITDQAITKTWALQLFKTILPVYEKAVWSNTRDDIRQNQFDALVSLCYNIGVFAFKGSTVLRRVNNNPGDKTIREAFLMWKNAGGKPVLLRRRIKEADLYFTF